MKHLHVWRRIHYYRGARLGLVLLLLVGILGGGTLVQVAPAFAQAVSVWSPAPASPTCSGSLCNGLDAYATHCAGGTASAVPLASLEPPFAPDDTVQLWWSLTCQSVWAVYTCVSCDLGLDLNLMVCPDGVHPDWNIQGPITLLGTSGRTRQQYLPATLAAADIQTLSVGTTSYNFDTGCY